MLKTGCVRNDGRARERRRESSTWVGLERARTTSRVAERRDDVGQVILADRFVQRDLNGVVGRIAEVDAARLGRGSQFGDTARITFEPKRVEVRGVGLAPPARGHSLLQPSRLLMHARRDGRDASGSVIHGIERRHVGEERLRRADVRRRLLAPDVLLAGLQRHPVRTTAPRIDRDADDASGHLPHESFTRRKERRMRPAVPERHAKALGVAYDHVGARLTGRRNNRERQEIRADGDQRARLMRPRDHRREIHQRAAVVGRLQVRAEHVVAESHRGGVGDAQRETEHLGAGRQQRADLRKHMFRDQKHLGVRLLADTAHEADRLRGGGRLHRGATRSPPPSPSGR